MNTGEAVAYLWELAGEPSDLDPWGPNETIYDPNVPGALITTSFGFRYFIKQINKAQNTLANMRSRRGRPIRFNKFITRRNVKLGLENPTSSVVSILTSDTIRVTDPPSTNVDDYIDTKINLIRTSLDAETLDDTDEQDFLVVQAEVITPNSIDFTFQEDIVDTAFTAETNSAEFFFTAFRIERTSVSGTGYTLNLPTYARNIIGITNMSNGAKLTRAEAKTKLYDQVMNEGTPIQWYKSGEVVYFDTYLSEPVWWIVDYQRLPLDVSTYDDEFDIPVQWQDVILMLVELDTARRMLENERATVLQQQVNTMISSLRTEEEDDWIGEETQGFYIRKEART